MEYCYQHGMIKHIGISNYTLEHLKELLEYATIKPYLHQFELHLTYFPEDVVNFCREHGIIIQAYSSFGEGNLLTTEFLQKYPFIREIADRHGKTSAQVLLKWALQHDFRIIPKSSHKERVEQNILLDFMLSNEEMKLLDEIHHREQRKFCWDPAQVK